jgi:hypothetical protein
MLGTDIGRRCHQLGRKYAPRRFRLEWFVRKIPQLSTPDFVCEPN